MNIANIKDKAKAFLENGEAVRTGAKDGEPIKPQPLAVELRKFSITTPLLDVINEKPANRRDDYVAEAIVKTQAVAKELKKSTPGPARAKALYNMLDKWNQHPESVPVAYAHEISCRVGCNHCCHITIMCSDDEADLLAGKVKSGEVEINMDLLKLQASRTDDADDYTKYPKHERACVFLGKLGSCMVYKDRPAVCRAYFVMSPPEMCDTTNKKVSGRVARIVDHRAEHIVGAGQSLDRTYGTMPQKLWERLKKK